MRRLRSDSGAVAVEFALVLIMLVAILSGIIDAGLILSQKLTLASAAREGARVMALQSDPVPSVSKLRTEIGLASAVQIEVLPPTGCPIGVAPGSTVSVKLTDHYSSIGIIALSGNPTAKVVMRCGG